MASTPGPNPLTRQMLEAPPLPLLLRMATPNALAFLVQASVSMAETAFVARLGLAPLAAIALMFPALMLMQMLANGAMGGGVASAIARALGRSDATTAAALIWHALTIAVGAGLLFSALWVFGGAWLLDHAGTTPAVVAEAVHYGNVLFAGTIPIWTMALLSAVVRGSGNMRLPALLMIISSVLQIPLSGALMLGWFGVPALGLAGSAVSIIIVATTVSAILIWRLRHPDAPLRLEGGALRLRLQHYADIFRVGLVAALSPVFTVLTIASLNLLIGRLGTETLAGYGIVARLEFLLVPLVFGIGAALTAMVGVNMGAGRRARAEHITWLGGACAAALTGGVGLLLAFAPGLWLDLFTTDPVAWAAGARYLQIVGPVFLFQGLGLAIYFASQGAGRVAWPVIATVLRFAIAVGVAAVGLQFLPGSLDFIYACIAVGMATYGVLTAATLALGAWRR